MSISNSHILLFGLGILFLVYWINAFFLLYHLIRFGVGPIPKKLAMIFFVGSVILFFLSAIALTQVSFPTFTSLNSHQNT